MSLVLRRLLLVLITAAIAVAGVPAAAGVLHTAHSRLMQQPAEQHSRGQHAPAGHQGAAAEVECSQVGHCSLVQLFSGAQGSAFEVSRRTARRVPHDVQTALFMPEASVPPPRRV